MSESKQMWGDMPNNEEESYADPRIPEHAVEESDPQTHRQVYNSWANMVEKSKSPEEVKEDLVKEVTKVVSLVTINEERPELEEESELQQDAKQSTVDEKFVVPQPSLMVDRKVIEEHDLVNEMDDDGTLKLFTHTDCNNHSSVEVQQYKGLVYDGDTLVSRGFSFTQEYNSTEDVRIIRGKLLPDKKIRNVRVFQAYEGSTIRVFYSVGKWYIATNRKLDGYRSKWSSQVSFGQMFEDAVVESYNSRDLKEFTGETDTVLETFLSKLDKSSQHMFLVRNNEENRIVCTSPQTPTVYYVCSMDRDTWKVNLDAECGLPKPVELKFETVTSILKYVDNIDYLITPGVFIFFPDGSQAKITNDNYQYYFKVRANVPSINYRYVQLLSENDQRQLKDLAELYPSSVKSFNEYLRAVSSVSQDIYNSYVSRFIHKNFVQVPQEQYAVVKEIHAWYMEDRKKHRVTPQLVENMVMKQPPTNLNRIIKRWLYAETMAKRGINPHSQGSYHQTNKRPSLLRKSKD